ncbi:MAG: hypothetical protein PHF79_01040 [Candidatus Pacebacteria bacterium]|nr:hypothetical protein [Candidatus Paceibacterota bacterium]
MSRGKFITLVVAISILVFGGLFGVYWYVARPNTTGGSTAQTQKSLFDFLSFGKNSPSQNSGTPFVSSTTDATSGFGEQNLAIPQLRQLSTSPVAGIDFIQRIVTSTSTASSTQKTKVVKNLETFIRFVDRATGNIFEAATSTLQITRVTNTTKPKIYEAYVANATGDAYIYRSLINDTDVIKNEFVSVQPATSTVSTSTPGQNLFNSTESILTSSPLPFEITALTLSPTRDQMFYVLNTSPRGIISKPDGTKQSVVFDSPLKEWLVDWVNSKVIAMTTKPSGTVPGYLYFLNPQTKTFSKILGGIKGLTSLVSPNGKKVLYAENTDGGVINMSLYQPDTNILQKLFIHTLPEKCAWSQDNNILYCAIPNNPPSAIYPDAWYQGYVAFSDTIWSINTTTGESKVIVRPQDVVTGASLDVTYPSLDTAEDALVFVDKTTLTPWVLNLPTNTSTPAVR